MLAWQFWRGERAEISFSKSIYPGFTLCRFVFLFGHAGADSSGLAESGCPHRSARRRPGLADDPRRESLADAKPRRPPSRASASPQYDWWNEGLHGVARSGYATVFPQAIGMAATWDTDLIHHEAEIISTEARAKYNDAIAQTTTASTTASTSGRPTSISFAILAGAAARKPTAKIPSSPAAWASPSSKACRATTRNTYKVIATPKHFAVHSGPERLRHTVQRRRLGPRSRRHLPARLPRHHHRGPCRFHHVRLQLHRRPARLRQHHAA